MNLNSIACDLAHRQSNNLGEKFMLTRARWVLPLVLALAACGGGGSSGESSSARDSSNTGISAGQSPNGAGMLAAFANSSGSHRTLSDRQDVSTDNPFFQSLGSNGRSCATCHDPSTGWTITPAFVQQRFDVTDGTDPLFRTVDGSNSPEADGSSVAARRESYSMLLNKGLIRIGLPIPDGAEFTLESVYDPYGFASPKELSLFRRPLPSTNLKFLSAVMWDGRESLKGQTMHANLAHQANDATRGHAEGTRDLTDEEREQIVDFETSLFTAQVFDNTAGQLNVEGAHGGVDALSTQEFFIGINDPLGNNPTGQTFDPKAFKLYGDWASLSGSDSTSEARRAVARGETIFNTKPIAIIGVKGLNDELGLASIPGTCTTCHDSPNVGNHSVPAPLDLGLTDESRRTPDLPLYTLRCTATGEVIKTTDPGRALVTGKCKDIGRFKGPILRDLAARAPYFHNGFAADLKQVAEFYNTRFNIGLSGPERADLVAFLKTL
jgi:cytochrome c peroxidase